MDNGYNGFDQYVKAPPMGGVNDSIKNADQVSSGDQIGMDESQTAEELAIQARMLKYNISRENAIIQIERGRVYGDPKDNHMNIANIWAGQLQPHWELIRQGKPVPPHVVALLMVGLKYSRMRLRFHQDNYDDMINYMSFSAAFHRDHENCSCKERIEGLSKEEKLKLLEVLENHRTVRPE